MSTTEIIEFTASDVYRTDQDVFAALAKLNPEDGVKSVYKGTQIEDPAQAVWLIDWETHGHYERLIASESESTKLFKEILPTATKGGQFNVTHVQFSGKYQEALLYPALELVYFTLKPGNTWQQLGPITLRLATNIIHSKGCHVPQLGPAIDKAGVYVGLIGWDSVEDHINAVKDGVLADIINEIDAVADVSLKHWKLTLLSK